MPKEINKITQTFKQGEDGNQGLLKSISAGIADSKRVAADSNKKLLGEQKSSNSILNKSLGTIKNIGPGALKSLKAAIQPGIEAKKEGQQGRFSKLLSGTPSRGFFKSLFKKYFGKSGGGINKWLTVLFLGMGLGFNKFFANLWLKLRQTLKAFDAAKLFKNISKALGNSKFGVKILERIKSIKGAFSNWIGRLVQPIKNFFSVKPDGTMGKIIAKFKSIKDGAKAFLSKLIPDFIKNLFVKKEGKAVAKPKGESKVLKVFKAIGEFVKAGKAGGTLKLVAKFIPFLIPVMAIWEAISGMMDGWDEAAQDPDASTMDKVTGAMKGGVKAIWNFFVTDFVNFVGGAVKWLLTKSLELLGFKDEALTLEGQDWKFGDMMNKWIGKAIDWVTGLFSFGEEAKKGDGEKLDKPEKGLMGILSDGVRLAIDWVKTLFKFTPVGALIKALPKMPSPMEMISSIMPDKNSAFWKKMTKTPIIGGTVTKFKNWLFSSSEPEPTKPAVPQGRSFKDPISTKETKPLTQEEFLRSEEYRASIGAGTKDYRGQSKGKQKSAYKDYLSQLKQDEGFRKGVYDDTEGIKTIGYGFNLERAGAQEALDKAGIKKSIADLKSGKVEMTEEEADRLMRGEYPHFRDVAKKFVGEGTWKQLSEDKRQVLTNMAYNMGGKSLNGFTKLRAAIQSKDWKEAGKQMASSKWAGQVKGRSDRLIARMGSTNDSGVQLANLQTESNQAAATSPMPPVVVSTDNSSSSTNSALYANNDPRNSQVGNNKSPIELRST